MEAVISETERLMEDGNFGSCHENNEAFHEVVLDLCDNVGLLRILQISRERLYNFPGNEIRALSLDERDLAM
jgi:DNA-binding GntR family transcriptional regulator